MVRSHGGAVSSAEKTYQDVFVARQPIFDKDLATWGYLLLFRSSKDASRAEFEDDLAATLQVVANMSLCPDGYQPGAKLVVHFPGRSIPGGAPYALPPEGTVVLLEETPDTAEYFLTAVSGLKAAGYTIGVNDFQARERSRDLCALADILFIDVLGKDKAEVQDLAAEARRRSKSALLLAKRVETRQSHGLVAGLGFDLFQGYFFREPKTTAGRTIPSTEVARLRLFELIGRDEPDFDAVVRAIQSDVAISYRLLTFMNSASFSFGHKVDSIHQAVLLVGWRPLRNWLRLVILTDILPTGKTRELTYLSAQRAKLFETVAQARGFVKDADRLFLLGLFSLLDAMFDMPMTDIVRHLPLDAELLDALCGRRNRLSAWLDLARTIEQSDWEGLRLTAKALSIPPGAIADGYQKSLAWADSFFESFGPQA